MLGLRLNRLLFVGVLAFAAACNREDQEGLVCPPPGDICYDNDGNQFYPDGGPVDDGGGDPTTDEDIDTDEGTDTDEEPISGCECDTSATDLDGDCILDSKETVSDPTKRDTDGDGILDGCEDKNFDGVVDTDETDPSNTDSDGDCIPDGVEDKDQDGRFELSKLETSALLADSDRDGIDDGDEDKNCNGGLESYVDTNGNGCFDTGETTGETAAWNNDTDGDGIGDGREDADGNGVCDSGENSCAFVADSDCDGISDGAEDKNQNGQQNTGETNPKNSDTDGDGLVDGIEDTNKNGAYESGSETDPRSVDSDGDGIFDGVEDANKNGVVDAAPRLADGCWDRTAGSGETDPRRVDSDSDGISDDDEDKNKNGECDIGEVEDPNAPGGSRTDLVESCSFLNDSDCDGISDGNEDKNRDGTYQLSETDARYNDTDRDGLIDGCPAATDYTQCEDRNNDGRVDAAETDPRSVDTDLDGLDDRCEVQFDPSDCTTMSCTTNPIVEDTDGDGKTDGEEDENHNCKYEPGLGETDPRAVNPTPAEGTEEYPRSQVCDSQNLKQLTFAAAPDQALDYRVAFEVEKFNATTTEYITQPFGIELASANNEIVEDDPNDMVWGHLFESPQGVVVDSQTAAAVNRNVYGFVYATQDTTSLDTTLDNLREQLTATYGTSGVVEVSNVPTRPAHDDRPNFRVYRAQRQYTITVASSSSNARSGLYVRGEILRQNFVPPDEASNVRPNTIFTDYQNDPVYGQVSCPSHAQCYQHFTMYISAVQRPQQEGPTATGVTLYVVAITPDDSTSNTNDTVTRLYNERLTRLEDLTGGSAVARYEARRSSTCEDRNAAKAKADLLFVVDDSASMQAVIDKLQQASRDAQQVLTANSNNVDYRIAMTTTNPSRTGRAICLDGTPGSAPNVFDPEINCLKVCPANCSTSCTDSGGTCNVAACGTSCYATVAAARAAEQAAVESDGRFTYELPGAGGTFYYEDTAWLDCNAATTGTDACDNTAEFGSELTTFYSGQSRKRLVNNRGFIGADPDATCPTAPIDLAAKVSAATTCDSDSATSDCCDRLIDACTDGPRVLTSQMCDLIRAMGGRPDTNSNSTSARPNSQNESGTRSARRLIGSMLPAYPADTAATDKHLHMRLDCVSGGSGEACDSDSDCGSFDYCDLTAPVDGRGQCVGTGNCQACDPRAGGDVIRGHQIVADSSQVTVISGASGRTCTETAECGRGEACFNGTCIVDCAAVPLVTIFLSDEEDFFFKDECATRPSTIPTATDGWQSFAQRAADEAQLPTDCYFRVQNPDTDGFEQAESCFTDDSDPFAYCSKFYSGTDYLAPATGYDPDIAPDVNSQNVQWRTYNAPECSVAASFTTIPDNTCLGDPCRLRATQSACNEESADLCVWNSAANSNGGACVNFCENITAGTQNPTATVRTTQRNECNATPGCFFDTGFGVDAESNGSGVTVDQQEYACVMKVPFNDCQACKRLLRRYQAVHGEETASAGSNLVGFEDVGPVYAIARDSGQEGFRNEGAGSGQQGQDQCAGGAITWGRGDGQAYRDIAIDTLGRSQNVCASSYQDFMQLLVTDIVALSAPYKLSESPIAATIKVGIGRPNGDGTWQYIEVSRSKTRGFVYDPTTNSLGFKSDPIDGVCPGFTCSADGTLEEGETEAARAVTEVPRTNDLVFISYRFWRDVPCAEGCASDETCVRSICPDEDLNPPTCATQDDCEDGRQCIDTSCVFVCTDDGYLERCVPNPCSECETYDSDTGACTPIGDACLCFSGEGTACNPAGENTCPVGYGCDESCTCQPLEGCEGAFNSDGSVANCDDAIECCNAIAACPTYTSDTTCIAPFCAWNASAGTCESASSNTCCTADETAICYTPIEDPSRTVFACQGGSCSCTTDDACTTDADCEGNYDSSGDGPGKCVGGFCDCNTQTQNCLSDSGGECACKHTPG